MRLIYSPLEQFEINDLNVFSWIGACNKACIIFILVVILFNFVNQSLFEDNIIFNRSEIDYFDESKVVFRFVYNTFIKEFFYRVKLSHPIWTNFLFYIFLFILFINISGLLPFSYTLSSFFFVVLFISLSIFIVINLVAVCMHGWGYFNIFLPVGVPYIIAPLLVIIEFFSYFARVLSLSIRLFANMMSGHMLIKILLMLVLSSLSITTVYIISAVLSVVVLSLVMCLEIAVSVLQAYVFFVLSSIYMGDVLETH